MNLGIFIVFILIVCTFLWTGCIGILKWNKAVNLATAKQLQRISLCNYYEFQVPTIKNNAVRTPNINFPWFTWQFLLLRMYLEYRFVYAMNCCCSCAALSLATRMRHACAQWFYAFYASTGNSRHFSWTRTECVRTQAGKQHHHHHCCMRVTWRR